MRRRRYDPDGDFDRLFYGGGDPARPRAPEPELTAAIARHLADDDVGLAVTIFTSCLHFGYLPAEHMDRFAAALADRISYLPRQVRMTYLDGQLMPLYLGPRLKENAALETAENLFEADRPVALAAVLQAVPDTKRKRFVDALERQLPELDRPERALVLALLAEAPAATRLDFAERAQEEVLAPDTTGAFAEAMAVLVRAGLISREAALQRANFGQELLPLLGVAGARAYEPLPTRLIDAVEAAASRIPTRHREEAVRTAMYAIFDKWAGAAAPPAAAVLEEPDAAAPEPPAPWEPADAEEMFPEEPTAAAAESRAPWEPADVEESFPADLEEVFIEPEGEGDAGSWHAELEPAPPPVAAEREVLVGDGGGRGWRRRPVRSGRRRRTTTRRYRLIPTRIGRRDGEALYLNAGIFGAAGERLRSSRPLAPDCTYTVAVALGPLAKWSAVQRPERFPDELVPESTDLTVTLFALEGVEIKTESSLPLPRRSAKQVSFTFMTLPDAQVAQFRCSVYCRNTLVQSLLLRAQVGGTWLPRRRAITAQVDFTLTHSLRSKHLEELAHDRLSLMLNESSDGRSNVFIAGATPNPLSGEIDGQSLQDLIQSARGALRLASWGDRGEWTENSRYRYAQPDLNALAHDLGELAVAGLTIYDAVIDRVVSRDAQADLAEQMREHAPEPIQVALKADTRFVLPAALFYDYGLDDQADSYTLCPQFLRALQDGTPLAECECFRGCCTSVDAEDVVCPSGFWGFRHELSLPPSADDERAVEIRYADILAWAVGASADPELTLRDEHLRELERLIAPVQWRFANERRQWLQSLTAAPLHLVYLYCHGGIAGTKPYIRIGPNNAKPITRASLRKLLWHAPGPLVFVNGCHTTAVEPEQAIEFVSAFTSAHASAVIGTEITVMEQLACDFALCFFRRFVVAGEHLAAAIRGARLDLLQRGNPLGLVYIPFAHGALRLAHDVESSRRSPAEEVPTAL